MKKIWQKSENQEFNKEVEAYTIGRDYELDIELLPYDILGSRAHARMLKKIGILNAKEAEALEEGLLKIQSLWEEGAFMINENQEDCHTAIEDFLTMHYGEVGKKIHTGRSRNDQVLVALRLFSKEKIDTIMKLLKTLILDLKHKINEYEEYKMPGYTHMQRAMPTTVGLWLESYHDSLIDDMALLEAVRQIIDQNPLGSAAGYGENILGNDRKLTTELLGFKKVQNNPLYCAFSRGKFENLILQAMGQVMFDLGKFVTDLLMFTTKEFNFFDLPDSFKTGSSIMPQKKNFDVLELMRGNVSIFNGYQLQIQELIRNLPLGYNRDFQLMKEPYFKGLRLATDTISIASHIVKNLQANKENLAKACSEDLYATDEVYKLVREGQMFRDAYRIIGKKYL